MSTHSSHATELWLRCCRTMSAQRDLPGLMKIMPLDVLMPTTQGLTLALPSGDEAPGHDPFGAEIKIAGVLEDITVMPSLQKPKRVRSAESPLCICTAGVECARQC